MIGRVLGGCADGRTRRVRAGTNLGVAISSEFAREVESLLGRGRIRLARV